MSVNDTYVKSSVGVADGNDLVVDASGSGTGEIDVGELAGTGGADIYREIDTNNDGSWATSVVIEQTSNNWHSQLDNLRCAINPSSGDPVRLRINNTSGASADYYVLGVEI